MLYSINGYTNNNYANKSLVCAYGKKKNIYEAYLFYKNQYIANFLFLENNKYKLRQNELRNYSLSGGFIILKPFKINRTSLQVIDTEFNKIIGNCNLVQSHQEAKKFMIELKNEIQRKYNNQLGEKET